MKKKGIVFYLIKYAIAAVVYGIVTVIVYRVMGDVLSFQEILLRTILVYITLLIIALLSPLFRKLFGYKDKD